MEEPDNGETLQQYAIRFTNRARSDIDAAHARFSELSGEEIAEEWQAGLFEAAASLAFAPRRQQIVPESAYFRGEVRQLLYRRTPAAPAYRLLFVIVESELDALFVRIVHVRHAARRPITRTEAATIEDNNGESSA